MDTDTRPTINYVAKLDPLAPTTHGATSWWITHGLGGPAAGSFTEVGFSHEAGEMPEEILDWVVRRVANDLYWNRWAFIYPPDEYEDAIAPYSMWRREFVRVLTVEVFD
jgi:hypothetical protein